MPAVLCTDDERGRTRSALRQGSPRTLKKKRNHAPVVLLQLPGCTNVIVLTVPASKRLSLLPAAVRPQIQNEAPEYEILHSFGLKTHITTQR
ncbi:hypothetical protein PG987_009582 [Apiospora arundinis]